ncbi:MAG: GNAT family N-acetyltransferase [Thermoanaerobaculia bacterium]
MAKSAQRTPGDAAVRRARESDAESIWRVHTDSIRALCAERYRPDEIEAWVEFRSPESYREANDSRALFVAEWQGAVIGFGQLDVGRGEIEACYVAPEAVGGGIGSALLAAMEDEARRRECPRVRLNSTLNAEPFYARRGYRWLGRARHRLREGVELDCVRMEKPLR